MSREGRILIGALVLVALALPTGAAAATIKVTTTTDELDALPDANCSLREAVKAASTNAAVGGCPMGDATVDTIKLGKHEYALTIPTTNEDAGVNGDLDPGPGGPLVVLGKGRGATFVTTGVDDRLFDTHGSGLDVTFRNATLSGGDVSGQGTGNGRGGVIRSDSGGKIVLDNVRIDGGRAYVAGGVYLNGGGLPSSLTVDNSQFDNNIATGLGGALDVVGTDTAATIKRTLFRDNSVLDTVDASTAGAISNRASSMKIFDTTIRDNDATGNTGEAGYGGALVSQSNSALTVRRSLVMGNTATSPTNNVFEAAGGFFIDSGTAPVRITNTTFYDNTAGTPDGRGGAIYVNIATDVLATNVTFADNVAGDVGGAIYNVNGTVTMRNSIARSADICGGLNIVSGGYNVADFNDPGCAFTGTDVVTPSPPFDLGLVAPPADHGGLTDTISLKKASQAVNVIPKSKCKPAKKEDQRGYRRPAGKRCDAGSFERKAKPKG